MIDGFEAPIYQGTWKRVLMGGAPRLWAAAWGGLALFIGLGWIIRYGFRGLVGACVGWVVGQATLAALTRWDGNFDDVFLAWCVRRYRRRYEAG